MKRTSNTDTSTPLLSKSVSSNEITTYYCNQISDASRVFNSNKFYESLILEKTQGTTKSLLGRYVDDICDLVPEIFLRCNLQDVLNLRLVSTGCYHLFSTINTFFKDDTLLTTKAYISFFYKNFHPITDKFLTEKFDFSKNNTQIVIIISLQDLIHELKNNTPTLYTIPPKRLNLSLTISSIKEVIQLQTLLSPLFNQNHTTFLDSIIAIDLNAIEITSETMHPINALLMTIAQNFNISSNLTKLSFGNITTYQEDESDTTLTIPNELRFLKSFSCGNIDHDAIVNLPEELPYLTSFSFGYLATNAHLNLPKQLNSLINFSCGNIYDNFTLPNKLKNLISFTCEHVWTNSTLTLPEDLQCLKYFRCKSIFGNATLSLPKKPLNLKSFSCRRVWGTLKFPEEVNYLSSLASENI